MRVSAARSDDARAGSACVSGHFGELLQGRVGQTLALVTLPCPLSVRAVWTDAPGPFRVDQPAGLLPDAWIDALFRATLGKPPFGLLTLTADMTPGAGCGASTAAILATARALRALEPDAEADLCLRIEAATDPLMHPDQGTLLWAPREARILGKLRPLPGLQVIGGEFGPPRRTDPADLSFARVDDLAKAIGQRGLTAQRLADISTESAERVTALRAPGRLDPIRDARAHARALGIVVAHTGSAVGLLLSPDADPAPARAALHEAGVTGISGFST